MCTFQTSFRQRLSGPGCVCARTSCDDGRRNRQQQDSTASRAGEVDTEYVRTYRFNSVNLCWVFLLKERIAASFGSQCGFCTPGIVMSMYTLLRNNPVPTQEQLQSAFEGVCFSSLFFNNFIDQHRIHVHVLVTMLIYMLYLTKF